jgi:hypothetical protein
MARRLGSLCIAMATCIRLRARCVKIGRRLWRRRRVRGVGCGELVFVYTESQRLLFYPDGYFSILTGIVLS